MAQLFFQIDRRNYDGNRGAKAGLTQRGGTLRSEATLTEGEKSKSELINLALADYMLRSTDLRLRSNYHQHSPTPSSIKSAHSSIKNKA